MSKQSRPADRAAREIVQWLLEIKFGLQVIVRWLSRKEDTRCVPYPNELIEEDDRSIAV